MAKIEGEGFCGTPCDIDGYIDSVNEMQVMNDTSLLEPEPTERFLRKRQALQELIAYQSEIIETCRSSAAERPCEGYIADGVKMSGLLTGITIYCPLVLDQFRSSTE